MSKRRRSFLGRLFGLRSPDEWPEVVDERDVMSKQKRGSPQVCFPFRVRVSTRNKGRWVTASAHRDWATVYNSTKGEEMGRVRAEVVEGKTLDVYSAYVEAPGCGIGTRLYEALAQHACDRDLRLRSDATRTEYSEGFWEKQRRKRRVVLVEDPDDINENRYLLKKCITELEAPGPKPRKRKR
jgi:hypothetical protein